MIPRGNGSLLLAYYGDDFTGSTDVLEALAAAGIRSMLFMSPPSRRALSKFPDLQAFGVAGSSRTMSPARMREKLPAIFRKLRASGAPVVHYKICSTFDSSPRIGSIGCAIDIGASILKPAFVPVVVGAPVLGRYVAFGNLFARSGLDSEPYRLDRHPTMAHHPVTPMAEADLRVLLGQQTSKAIELVDIVRLETDAPIPMDGTAARIVIFDTLNQLHLRRTGQVIWKAARRRPPLFSASSSGLEYALIEHWRTEGFLKPAPPRPAAAVKNTVVISASCSPVTARQIEWATAHGWADVALYPSALLSDDRAATKTIATCLGQLNRGRNVVLHTALGPKDRRIRRARARSATGAVLGRALGKLLGRILAETKLPRVGVTGGDSSFHVAEALKVEALEYLAPMAPGSPLCRIHAREGPANNLECVFKGGQVGKTDFFGTIVGGQ